MTADVIKGEIDSLQAKITQKHNEFAAELAAAKAEGADTKGIAQKGADTILDLETWKQKAQEQLDHLDAASQRLAEKATKHANFGSMLAEEFSKTDRIASLKALKEGDRSASIGFKMKVAANMLIGTNYTGGVIGITDFDTTISRPARRDPFLRQLFNVRPVSKAYVSWAELAARDGGAAFTAEGGLKPLADFDYIEASRKVEKVAVRGKASREMMDDVPNFVATLNQELTESVELEMDRGLYAGTGTSPEILGISNIAQTLSVAGTPFATGVRTPNRADVLMVAVAILEGRFRTPTHILVNPFDRAMMMLDKDTQGNGLTRPYTMNGNTFMGSVQLVANTLVPIGTFLIGDFTRAILGLREDINVTVGYENDDFTRNLVSMIAEMRAVLYVRSNDIGAFAKGTFATVITSITAV